MDNFDKKILPQSYVCKQQTVGGVNMTDYQTFSSADSFIQDGVEFLYDLKFTGISQNVEISNADRGNVEYATNNTTVTATEFTSSVGGSSASSGAYYEIKTSDIAFYDENGTQITTNVLDNLRITLSEGQFEALKVKMNPILTQMSMPTLTDINSLLTILNGAFTETSASASNNAYNLFIFSNGYCDFSTSALLNGVPVNIPLVFFVNLSMGFLVLAGANGQGDVSGTSYDLLTAVDGNDTPMGISATWTLSQYGTSGGSSSSESYYKIVLEDVCYQSEPDGNTYHNTLTTFVYKDDFNALLTQINTAMGTSLATPTDFINFYDGVKGNSQYQSQLIGLFGTIVIASKKGGLHSLYETEYDFGFIADITLASIMGVNVSTSSGSLQLFNMNPTRYEEIAFTSSSTLTITEQTNQKI